MKGICKLLATLVALTPSVLAEPLSADKDNYHPIVECPLITDDSLKTLSEEGKVNLNGKEYTLIDHEKAGDNYFGRLLETKEKLADLLAKAKTHVTAARLINTHQNQHLRNLKNHCPYSIENGPEPHVLALQPNS